GPERRPRPLRGIALRDHVGVPFEEEAAAPGALLADPGKDVGAAGRDILDFDGKAFATEPALDEGRDLGLVRPRLARPVHAGDADERAGELDQLLRVDLPEDAVERAHRAQIIPAERTG